MKNEVYFEDVNIFVENDVYEKGKFKKLLLPDNFILDRNKSIIWNEETVAKLNENSINFNKKIDRGLFDKATKFEDDLIAAIQNESNMNKKQAEIIYYHAFEEGRSSGDYEILNYAMDLTSLVKKILKKEVL